MLAVLVDADNLSSAHADRILAWATSKDPHPVVRLFGDFSAGRHTDWCERARTWGMELVFQPNGGQGKNSTDIALTIHAMDLLHGGVVSAFCLASDDRDFIPLATRLHRSGRHVFVAAKTISNRMAFVCHDVLELVDRPLPPLVAAFLQVAEGKDTLPLSVLGQRLRKHAPQVVPPGAGKLRKALRESGWFTERDTAQIVISLRQTPV